jgi:nicotinamidase/pyrazinamidase
VSSLVFVDVDTQHDFCDPSGSLYVSGSPIHAFRALVARAVASGAPIVGSVDSHSFDAWEFASSGRASPEGTRPNFPDHCVKGTAGWLKVPGTLAPRSRFVPLGPATDPHALASELASGEAHALYFEKEVYSLFVNPAAEPVVHALSARLAARHGAAPTFVVFGVATDYCVRAAALGLAQRGHRTRLVVDAIAAVTEEGGRTALAEMVSAGVELVRASDVLGESAAG